MHTEMLSYLLKVAQHGGSWGLGSKPRLAALESPGLTPVFLIKEEGLRITLNSLPSQFYVIHSFIHSPICIQHLQCENAKVI